MLDDYPKCPRCDAAESELENFKSKETRAACWNCGAPCESCDQLAKLRSERDEARLLVRDALRNLGDHTTIQEAGTRRDIERAIARWDAEKEL